MSTHPHYYRPIYHPKSPNNHLPHLTPRLHLWQPRPSPLPASSSIMAEPNPSSPMLPSCSATTPWLRSSSTTSLSPHLSSHPLMLLSSATHLPVVPRRPPGPLTTVGAPATTAIESCPFFISSLPRIHPHRPLHVPPPPLQHPPAIVPYSSSPSRPNKCRVPLLNSTTTHPSPLHHLLL